MDGDDDDFGTAFGLGTVLAEVGVDSAALSAFLERTEGAASRQAAAAVDEAGDKFMDDVSEASLPDENEEDREARRREQAAIRAEEDRWARRARLEMATTADPTREKKRRQREDTERDLIRQVWPDFAQGSLLRMSEIFYETPADRTNAYAALVKKKRRLIDRAFAQEELSITVGPRPPSMSILLPNLPALNVNDPAQPSYLQPIGAYFDPEWIKEARDVRRSAMTRPPDGFDAAFAEGKPLDLAEWEKDIAMYSLDGALPRINGYDPLRLRNDHLDTGDWMKEIVWDTGKGSPDLMEDNEADGGESPEETKKAPTALVATKLDPFNLSNDHLYEHSRASRYRIRQTFGAIEVFHSYPAKVLQMPFYKTTLSKIEARAWHRPVLQFPSNVWLGFTKLRSNPNSSQKRNKLVADPSERFKTTKDLSLTEKGPYVLLEFSEEYPPIMSGYGMGTTIVNYYRKKDDRDETVPKLELGQPSILNVGDAEPFLLGYVDPGKVTQVIHNNLLRAPIFKHQPEPTDFLIIRQTINGHASYYIREIKDLFVVGQTVPNESEVPGPHARKNTNTAKLRLMIVAWILIKKNKDPAKQRVKLSRLIKYFPDQTELQMRQRLKIKGNEFLEYDKDAGFHSGYWKLNPNYNFPTERAAVQATLTPENACLYEAMQVGAQHLRDAGYTKTADGNADDELGENGEGLDIEQQLAVWSTTLNYKKAEAQKAWLLIHGDGDPTGRGEGFSFLKTNMKNYFLRKGETEEGRRLEAEAKAGGGPVKISNAEQNRIYEEEKRKVWDLQAKALSSHVPPVLTAEDDQSATQAPAPPTAAPRHGKAEPRHFSRAGSLAATPGAFDSPMEEVRSPSQFSFDGESQWTGNDRSTPKVLRINRIVKGKPTVEIVRDPAVIASYLRRVEERKLAQFTEELDHLKPSGNIEEDDLKIQALRQEVLRLKKNQQRRQQRKKYAGKGELPDVGEGEGKRKCGACGAYGHTKANRNCPKFAQSNIAPSPTTSTPISTSQPYGIYGAMDAPPQTPTESAAPAPMKIKLAFGRQ